MSTRRHLHSPPIVARIEESLINLVMRICVEGIGSTPVIDENGKLEGIITETDILEDLAKDETIKVFNTNLVDCLATY